MRLVLQTAASFLIVAWFPLDLPAQQPGTPRGIESVLARLDTFTAAPTGKEGWDRLKAASVADRTTGELIPSKRMMLVRGVCLVIRYRIDGTFKPALAEKSEVSDALKVYETAAQGDALRAQ